MKATTAAAMLSIGRVMIGAGLVAAPERVAAGWIGPDAELSTTRVLGRGLGARDVALGLGTLAALRNGEAARSWAVAGVIADVTDASATLLAGRSLPPAGRNMTLAVAGGAALVGLWLVAALD